MKKFIFSLSIVMATVLSGCNSDSGTPASSSAASTATATIASVITTTAIDPAITNLTATLYMLGVQSEPVTLAMTLNADNTFSVELPEIPAGQHTFTISYYGDGLLLGEVITRKNIEPYQVTLIDFGGEVMNQNFDEDFDGWVNLAEIQWSSDPYDPFSIPIGGTTKNAFTVGGERVLSASYVANDAIGLIAESGISSSATFTLEGGFTTL